jgi:hypothetical protein
MFVENISKFGFSMLVSQLSQNPFVCFWLFQLKSQQKAKTYTSFTLNSNLHNPHQIHVLHVWFQIIQEAFICEFMLEVARVWPNIFP